MSQVKMVRRNLGKGSSVSLRSDSLLGHKKDGKALQVSHERWDFHVAWSLCKGGWWRGKSKCGQAVLKYGLCWWSWWGLSEIQPGMLTTRVEEKTCELFCVRAKVDIVSANSAAQGELEGIELGAHSCKACLRLGRRKYQPSLSSYIEHSLPSQAHTLPYTPSKQTALHQVSVPSNSVLLWHCLQREPIWPEAVSSVSWACSPFRAPIAKQSVVSPVFLTSCLWAGLSELFPWLQ